MKKDINGTVTLFIYNQSGQLIAEANGSGVIQREYAYYQNRPIAMLAYGTTADVYYYHTDHLNTPQVMTDQAQGVVWQGDYEPFGEVDITTDVVENNLRFPGQYYDAETGSYYNYFRDYDPGIGRYVESDPIGLRDGVNTYVYAKNSPVRLIDPTGEASGGAAAAAAALAARLCAKNPKSCREMLKCIKNPKKCGKKLCASGVNSIKHAVCDGVGGSCKRSGGSSCLALKIKQAGNKSCLKLRQFEQRVCFSGRTDRGHAQKINDTKNRINICKKKMKNKCC